MLAVSVIGKPKDAWTNCRRPMALAARSSRIFKVCACARYGYASTRYTSLRRAASNIARASAAVVASGFSHSTCLPASAARIDHLHANYWATDCRSRRYRNRPAAPHRSRALSECRCPWRMPGPSRHRGSPPPQRRSCSKNARRRRTGGRFSLRPNANPDCTEPVVAITIFLHGNSRRSVAKGEFIVLCQRVAFHRPAYAAIENGDLTPVFQVPIVSLCIATSRNIPTIYR